MTQEGGLEQGQKELAFALKKGEECRLEMLLGELSENWVLEVQSAQVFIPNEKLGHKL